MLPSSATGSPLALQDGARIAVIGGGPSGSFFAIFALKMARMIGRELQVTIFEPKDFTKDGPGGCNKCGGIISELLVQTLALEGIGLPDTVVRKGVNSYRLHSEEGEVTIAAPGLERRIASVYRGGGPKGAIPGAHESFDHFLLGQAVAEGATHRKMRIDRVEIRNGLPVLFSNDEEVLTAELLVGAFGLSSTARVFENIGFGYHEPPSITTAIAELKKVDQALATEFAYLELKGDEAQRAADISGAKEVAKWADQ